MSLRIVVVLAIMALVIVACDTGSKPAFGVFPTPTTPPDFVKYSDELSIYSIEYPPDWQINFSEMSPGGQATIDFIQGISDLPVEDLGFLFFENSSNPLFSTTIVVKSLSSG